VRNAAYLGVFGVRDEHGAAAVPAPNYSGLWHTWEMAEGGYRIQALTHEHQPIGDHYPIKAEDFHALLIPAPTPEGLAFPSDPRLEMTGQRADSPDLLFFWYDQAVQEEGEDGPLAGENEARPSRRRSTLQDDGVLARDEKRLTPVWHPDELLDQENEMPEGQIYTLEDFTAPPPKKRRRPQDTAHPKRRHGQPSFHPASGHVASGASPPTGHADRRTSAKRCNQPKAEGTDPARSEALRETEALAREKNLRRAFDALNARLENADQPAIERQIAELLGKNYDFGWKQKFLFSDFGMALRRKRKYALALMAHRLALKLAPDDENIMFNVARAEYEMGDTVSARDYLDKALRKAPDFASARTFRQFLEGSA
jgi:tetratricopeptide (TPR) repeat protein